MIIGDFLAPPERSLVPGSSSRLLFRAKQMNNKQQSLFVQSSCRARAERPLHCSGRAAEPECAIAPSIYHCIVHDNISSPTASSLDCPLQRVHARESYTSPLSVLGQVPVLPSAHAPHRHHRARARVSGANKLRPQHSHTATPEKDTWIGVQRGHWAMSERLNGTNGASSAACRGVPPAQTRPPKSDPRVRISHPRISSTVSPNAQP